MEPEEKITYLPMPKIEYHLMEFVVVAAAMLAAMYFLLPAITVDAVWAIDAMKGWSL